ncbi:hypothetical protein BC940DRAFT_353179 [Gongronella butleri]|nr:hypothetical protein BC940DRAFT_353179 [Gongronella butleri]
MTPLRFSLSSCMTEESADSLSLATPVDASPCATPVHAHAFPIVTVGDEPYLATFQIPDVAAMAARPHHHHTHNTQTYITVRPEHGHHTPRMIWPRLRRILSHPSSHSVNASATAAATTHSATASLGGVATATGVATTKRPKKKRQATPSVLSHLSTLVHSSSSSTSQKGIRKWLGFTNKAKVAPFPKQ